jgi:excisionase family DNA binding protein
MEAKAVNIVEAAKLLGLHPHTVKALVDEGRLHAVQVGRRWLIPLVEIDRFLEPQGAGGRR